LYLQATTHHSLVEVAERSSDTLRQHYSTVQDLDNLPTNGELHITVKPSTSGKTPGYTIPVELLPFDNSHVALLSTTFSASIGMKAVFQQKRGTPRLRLVTKTQVKKVLKQLQRTGF